LLYLAARAVPLCTLSEENRRYTSACAAWTMRALCEATAGGCQARCAERCAMAMDVARADEPHPIAREAGIEPRQGPVNRSAAPSKASAPSSLRLEGICGSDASEKLVRKLSEVHGLKLAGPLHLARSDAPAGSTRATRAVEQRTAGSHQKGRCPPPKAEHLQAARQ